MNPALITVPVLVFAVALAGCDRSNPAPSEKLGRAAEKIVGIATPTASPTVDERLGAFAPRDGCSDLEGASSFLAALRAAVAMRDTDVLLALTANDVKLGFGGQDGKANLRRALDNSDTGTWDRIAEVLELGCAKDTAGGITLPWYFAQPRKLEPFESMIVTGKDVPLRERPDVDAPVLRQLDWDEVELVRGEDARAAAVQSDPEGWQHVRFPGNPSIEGYIQRKNLRSPIDYRLLASSRNGRWRITAFLAGD